MWLVIKEFTVCMVQDYVARHGICNTWKIVYEGWLYCCHFLFISRVSRG